MTTWQTKTIGDITDTQLGKMLNKSKQNGKYSKPYLRTDNVHWGRFDLSEIKEMDFLPDEVDKYLAKKGDLLMCEGGAAGRTAIWSEDYEICFQNHVHRIRPKDLNEISSKYLLYYFEWFIKNGFASNLIKGVTINSLSQAGLRSIQVTYPPLGEQNKIIELLEEHLSRLDNALAEVKNSIRKVYSYRKSLLRTTFMRITTQEENPLESFSFADAFAIGRTIGKSIKQKDYLPEGEFPIIDQGEDFVGGYSNDDAKLNRFDKPVIVFGDHTRRLKYINFDFIAGADGTKILVPKPSLNSRFAYFQLNSFEIRDRGYARHFSELKKESIWCPPIDVQIKIVESLEYQFSRFDESIKLSSIIQNQSSFLRRSLLQAAFKGQLTKEVFSD